MDTQAALGRLAEEAARGDMIFPTHADIALSVRRTLDHPDCSLEQLNQLISAEPLLSARVVGLANTVAYNPAGRISSDLRSAVSRLGFNTLRTLTTALIVRQMRDMPGTPEYRAMAAGLWEHTAHVAALARVIAKRVTGQDPEAAFFAGIVHEVGSFYLLSRAGDFPALLSGNLEVWHDEGQATVGRAVLNALDVPAPVRQAIETLWKGYLALPPESLGDTLLLADELAPVKSPLTELAGMRNKGATADIDVLIGEEMLNNILKDSAAEVASLTSALNA